MHFLNGVYLLLAGFPSNNSLVHNSFIETELRPKNDRTIQTGVKARLYFYIPSRFSSSKLSQDNVVESQHLKKRISPAGLKIPEVCIANVGHEF